MAHLEVERKPKKPSWLWILIVVLFILLAGTILKQCVFKDTEPSTDRVPTDSTARPS